MTKFGISEISTSILFSIFSKYNQVNQVKVYGSRAKGNYQERSDLDLIICDSAIDRKLLGMIILDINNSNFPYIVNLQVFENLKNRKLIEHINRVGKLFYKKTSKKI